MNAPKKQIYKAELWRAAESTLIVVWQGCTPDLGLLPELLSSVVHQDLNGATHVLCGHIALLSLVLHSMPRAQQQIVNKNSSMPWLLAAQSPQDASQEPGEKHAT